MLAPRRIVLGLALPAIPFALGVYRGGMPSSPEGLVFFGSACLSLLCVWPARWSEVLLWLVQVVGLMGFAYIRPHADEIGLSVQYAYPIFLDRLLLGGTLPTAFLQETLYKPGSIRLHDYFFFATYVSYFLLPSWALVAAWHTRRELFSRFLVAFVLTFWLGLIGYFLLPTAPPWLAARDGELQDVTKVTRQVAQELSPGRYEAAANRVGNNEVAAMPSLHFAIPFLIAIVGARIGRLPGLLTGAYVVAMAFALVYLGEHYVIDMIAGGLLAYATWRLAAYIVPAARLLASRLTLIAAPQARSGAYR
jgi:membrane-associated phospholipid phosphatase